MARPRKPAPAAPAVPSSEKEVPPDTPESKEEKVAQDSNVALISTIKDVVTLLGGATIFLVACLWLFGRKYTQGYYSSLGLPASEIELSNWEYGEFGWEYTGSIAFLIFMIVIATILIMAILHEVKTSKSKMERFIWVGLLIILIIAICALYIYLSTSMITFGALISALFASIVFIQFKPKNSGKIPSLMLFLCYAMTFFIVTLGSINIIIKEGSKKSIEFYTADTQSVRVLATRPLIRDYPSQVISDTIPLYLYENLNLIIVNNNKYFLATGLTDQCKPERVFVLKAEDVASVEYTSKAPLKPGCVPAEPGAATVPISSTPALTSTPGLTLPIPTLTP
jgi:hypothetical protein